MWAKKVGKYYALGLMVLLVGFVFSLIGWYVYAQALSVDRKQVLLTTSFKIGAKEQKFKAFYLSAPAEEFLIDFNVSMGSIKFSPWQASLFENSLGYFDYYINETTVEKHQVWFFEGNNGTAGCGIDPIKDTNQIWYIHFFNEDSYEKEVYIQITKVWHSLF